MTNISKTFHCDKEIIDASQDVLGFEGVASTITEALTNKFASEAAIFGLEGEWGSGKSSLLNLIEEKINNSILKEGLTLIKFSPWLIGDRDALMYYFFSELSKSINDVANKHGDARGLNKERAENAINALKEFGKGLSKLGGAIETIGDASSLGPLKYFGKLIGNFDFDKKQKPLEKLKIELINALNELNHRFLVIIDDIDRLEPKETVEVLRLAKSVANLPKITYLLSYDRKVVSSAIEAHSKIEDGSKYLEKIIQLAISVPIPEAFQLRSWFASEIIKLFQSLQYEEVQQIQEVINYEGANQLTTPRAVNRCLDSIRFHLKHIKNHMLNKSDFIWLQMVKTGNPDLYRWIEKYCTEYSVLSLNAGTVDENEQNIAKDQLIEIATDPVLRNIHYSTFLSLKLPGIQPVFSKDDAPIKIFQNVDKGKMLNAIKNRNVASPDHYRLYFALSDPTHVISVENYDKLYEHLESEHKPASNLLLGWHAEKAVSSLTKFDIFLERFETHDVNNLTDSQLKTLLICLSSIMDQIYKLSPTEDIWYNSTWTRAENVFSKILKSMENSERIETISKIFAEGDAIGWLTNIFRHETFSHGRAGEQRKPNNEWYFSDKELDKITSILKPRYEEMSIGEILNTPSPINILYAWLQGVDKEGPIRLADKALKSEEEFLQFVEAISSEVNSSDRGRFHVLKKENAAPFIDPEKIIEELNRIKENSVIAENKAKAAEFLKMVDIGKHY